MGNNWVKDDPSSDKQSCMYCKRADVNAGYMNTFSYCPKPDNK